MTDLAAEACTLTETYMYLVNKSTKIRRKLSEIRKEAEQKEQQKQFGQPEIDNQLPADNTAPDVSHVAHNSSAIYKEPDVAKSKGRPKVQGRQKTLAEEIFTKQQITCSHCGDHDHNIKTCKKLAIDKEKFQKGKRSNKTKQGSVPTATQNARKKQRVAVASTRKAGAPKTAEKNKGKKPSTPKTGGSGHANTDISSPFPQRDVQSPRIRKPTRKAIESMLLTPSRKQRKQDG
ncbi:hypothetical protein BRADI_3g14889v3 [Brachypodium distachyon]|uniref:Uncharacterized protein n=1 Tax=Brachypodium distachyon TaxID=15368 RepID=A0A2K2CX57_BRADI|nr:hypothetical protein BRADI_3g14889v3 [Brachypodium distachyon]